MRLSVRRHRLRPPSALSAADSPQLRRAAVTVGLRIAAAIALLVVAVMVAAALFMLYLSDHPDFHAADTATRVYVETDDMLQAMAVAGVAGIVAAGAIGWLSARSAIRPLGRALELQRHFVQDASHELRTPLTILDARIQLAEAKVDAGSDAARLLAQVRQDTAALSATVQELLLAATAEADEQGEPLDIVPEVEAVVASLQDLAAARSIRLQSIHNPSTRDQAPQIQARYDGAPLVRIAPNSLRRAVLGLVENAMNHTPEGGTITVDTSWQGRTVVLTVSDTGTGITGIEPERVFDRFAHSSTPLEGGRRSFGLGLALVREIASAAGGSIEVTSTGPQGTTFELSLPAAH
ncbi:sensor histidine kinase [Arthrobacter psychrochitiniphilus]|uniref:histidine kinase n=1 Tax=Arthrobacter psychrochitiniphilus TaxID=291045 RepID=A0A2V3DT77_9MICC|nr:HAMP domain-containing sensor histidine kinase [Arthrobacter psychrochitiniphilus]NYG18641.1 signal transduction histidine kinase [Arthrobacter psychrochitiniphilus]PXA66416.1 sensor histidine kinase [Arthrobacter psychrochitiniphilus]